ncbi:MAG TPA: hypothetical protein DEA28_00740 [Firmicutes bacterium]|nr:hypothetical protein [Bacillota bacterium]
MENRIKTLTNAFLSGLEDILKRYNEKLVVYNKASYDELPDIYIKGNYISFEIKGIKDWIFYVFWKGIDYQGDFNFYESWRFCAYFKDNEKKLQNEIVETRVCEKNQKLESECFQAMGFSYIAFAIIKFIYEEPELAFCRAYYGWDYNLEYHSKRTAKKKYKAYLNCVEKMANVDDQNDIEMFNTFKDYFKDKYVGVTSLGINNYPRFMIQVKSSFYGNSAPLGKAYIKKIDNVLYELYTEKLTKCYNRSNKYGTAWKNLFSDYIEIIA